MDRARHPSAARSGRVGTRLDGRRGGALRGRASTLVLAAAIACGQLGPDLNGVVALSVAVRDSVEELDTLPPPAFALGGRGDSVAAPIPWAPLQTALRQGGSDTTR